MMLWHNIEEGKKKKKPIATEYRHSFDDGSGEPVNHEANIRKGFSRCRTEVCS